MDEAARELVSDLVATALVDHCDARFAPDWDANATLVDASGQPVDVRGLVAAATEKGSADWLVRALEDEGVPGSYSIDVAALEEEQAHGREPLVQAVAACVQWRRVRIVVVAENALVVKRMGWRESVSAAFTHGHGDVYGNAVSHVASLPLEQLLADRRATVYRWEQVGPARLAGRRLTLGLDGRNHRFRVRRRAVAGDLAGTLREHLGPRLALS